MSLAIARSAQRPTGAAQPGEPFLLLAPRTLPERQRISDALAACGDTAHTIVCRPVPPNLLGTGRAESRPRFPSASRSASGMNGASTGSGVPGTPSITHDDNSTWCPRNPASRSDFRRKRKIVTSIDASTSLGTTRSPRTKQVFLSAGNCGKLFRIQSPRLCSDWCGD